MEDTNAGQTPSAGVGNNEESGRAESNAVVVGNRKSGAPVVYRDCRNCARNGPAGVRRLQGPASRRRAVGERGEDVGPTIFVSSPDAAAMPLFRLMRAE